MKNTSKTQVKKPVVKKADKASKKAKPAKTARKAAVKPAKKPATKPAKKASVKPAKKPSVKKARVEAPRKKKIVNTSAKKKTAAGKQTVKKSVSKTASKSVKKPVSKPVSKTAKPADVKKPAKTQKPLKPSKPTKTTKPSKSVKPPKSSSKPTGGKNSGGRSRVKPSGDPVNVAVPKPVPVVENDDSDVRFSDAELSKFRQAMLDMRAKALNKAESLQSQSLVRNDEVNQEEDGTDANMRATELTKANMNERQVRQIDDALKAIADGTYGICKNCGAKIGKARLEARPFAEYCIDCQESIEHDQAIRSGFVPLAYYESNR